MAVACGHGMFLLGPSMVILVVVCVCVPRSRVVFSVRISLLYSLFSLAKNEWKRFAMNVSVCIGPNEHTHSLGEHTHQQGPCARVPDGGLIVCVGGERRTHSHTRDMQYGCHQNAVGHLEYCSTIVYT